MGVQESLDNLYNEQSNRWTKLTGTADPNTLSGYDGAPIGITYVRTGTDPVVVWIKNRAGASGWDLYGGNATSLQGRALAATAPADTNVLTWNAGAAQWQPAAGGGGGSSKQSWIVVGNSVAGDTSAICDYLDTGNGAQLVAAIAAAQPKSQTVYVRPGVYDLNAAGAPAGVIAVGGCTVIGAGVEYDSVSPDLGVEIRTRTSGVQSVFYVTAGGSIHNMRIKVQRPTSTCTGTYIVYVGFYNGAWSAQLPGYCRNIIIEPSVHGNWTATQINRCQLTEFFRIGGTGTGKYVPLQNCWIQPSAYASYDPRYITSFNAVVPGRYLSGVYIESMSPEYVLDTVSINYLDYGVYGAGGGGFGAGRGRLTNMYIRDSVAAGVYILGGSPGGYAKGSIDNSMIWVASGYSLVIAATSSEWIVTRCTIRGGAINIAGDNIVLQNNQLDVAAGVTFSGAYCSCLCNSFYSVTTVTFTAASSYCQWGINTPKLGVANPTVVNAGANNTRISMVAL